METLSPVVRDALGRDDLRLVLDSTAEGIYVLDLNGKCIFCNRAAAVQLGYRCAAELLGKSMHDVSHHTTAAGRRYPRDECLIHRAFRSGERLHVDHEVFWRADGSSFPVEYWSYPAEQDGAVVGAIVTFLDITERRKAQAALEQSEARFRALSEASFDGIIVSVDGMIRDANRGVSDMWGYSIDELIGRPAVDLAADESQDLVRRQIADGHDGRYEIHGRRKDGRKIVVEVTAKEQRVGGRRERITALRDVTSQRVLEERFRQAQKMEAVGRLAGGVAHDFNNLLTVISSYTSLLLEGTGHDDATREDLEEIRKAGTSAAALTRQLLTFSRQQVIEPTMLVLADAVTASSKMLQCLLGRDIVLSTNLSEPSATVGMDPGQLEQVMMNLAANARDAMPDGGNLLIETGTAELAGAEAPLDWPSVAGRFAVLSFSDTGVGMDTQTRARIFEPFFTTKAPGRGTGLGLATVHGIVHQSGGSICVYSEPGQGTTFKVYLPLAGETSEVVVGASRS